MTATFQTGVGEYSGTVDGEISNRGGPNGSTDMVSPTARIMRSKHPTREYAALVKFTDLSLPPGAVVTSAELTLTFETDGGGHSLRGHYVRRGWNDAHVGWGLHDTGMWWNTPGAKGMGTDVIAAPAFVDDDWSGTGTVRRTYSLEVEEVQRWIDDPSTNRGLVLSNNEGGSLRMYTADSAATANRPRLTIQYAVPDGAVITLAAAAHPRIWMDAQVLQRMRDRAMAADARWVALRSVCNSYLPGVVRAPHPVKCQDSCSGSTICCGFQGESYYPALLNLGLCYQIGRRLTPADPSTTAWAQKGAAVLAQMVTFTNYSADHGYGIRNFATGMAIGYDWLYDYLSANEPALAANVVTSLNGWIDWYDAQPASFNFRQHPTSNYFAGYYAAKALTALATEGESSSAAGYWTAFLGMHRTSLGTHAGIAPYYTRFFDGGGWAQGWQYGPLAVRNMIEPSLAAMTAKGVDLVADPGTPYRYAVNNGLHLLHFSTPSLTMMDDRDELASFNPADPGACPSKAKTPVSTAVTLTEMLRRWPVAAAPSGDPVAPRLHSFARAVRSIYPNAPWNDMLFWDDAAAEAPYTATPDRSYLATNYVSMRSDWSTSATMATMRAIAYSDKDNTHEHPDGGSLIITRGNGGPAGAWQTDVPFLVSPNFLLRCYGTTGISSTWANNLRTDLLTSAGARATLNIFRSTTTSGQSITIYQDAVPAPQSQIRTFEDRGKFVLARAENLDDLYASTTGISEWSRDVVFVRPNMFVVYDRTTNGTPTTGTADPHLSWHFAPTPVLATPPSPGAVRYDVADGGVFKGAITTLLPASASVSGPENVYASNKLFALRVRGATTTGSIKWLTVFDTSTTAANVALASRVAALTTNINGARLAPRTGANTVVLFGTGAAGAPISGTIRYTEPAAATALYVTDLAPNATYAVTTTGSGSNRTVTIAPATSGFASSPRGTLYVTIAANGAVSAGI